MTTPEEPGREPPEPLDEPEPSAASPGETPKQNDHPSEPDQRDEPVSGTDLGLGPEPSMWADQDASAPPVPTAHDEKAPADPFIVGSLIPAVPAAAPVLHPLGEQGRAGRAGLRPQRTWAQRALLVLNCIVIAACFVGAGALLIARSIRNNIPSVSIPGAVGASASPETLGPVGSTAGSTPDEGTVAAVPVSAAPGDTSSGSAAPEPTAPPETFPPADPTAKNFLITGADNNSCIDPDSPFAGAFGGREALGERSDTVMVMRVDPANKRAAILSFPRDLWVQIYGRNKNRINSAYVKDDPGRLILTIRDNFSIGIDHFIQVDFCAFKRLVDAVGGVSVPFDHPARDENTGLNVPTGGGACFTFDGDHALAYVRSRHYEYQDESGKWKEDPASDLGRISRQQDFIRRALEAALDKGIYDPGVARGLIDIATQNIVKDDALTITKMFELFGVLRDFNPGAINTYQIEAKPQNISGNAVLIPQLKGENMQAILRIFQGIAPLAGAPEQVFATSTTVAAGDADASTAAAPQAFAPGTTVAPTPPTATAVIDGGPDQNVKGIVPPPGVTC
jgi:LCP family protein required for cell wall assembly